LFRSSCLRKLRGLKHVRLVDASWVWTEHHSRRLRLKLTVARDMAGASGAAYMTCLQQSLLVEYVVRTRNCDACNKIAAKDTWSAKVQVRQRAEHPRTLLALEQHMTKHKKSRVALREVKREGDGLDFYFGRRQDAHRFAMGVCSMAPCQCKASSSLVAANARTGTSNVKHGARILTADLEQEKTLHGPSRATPRSTKSSRIKTTSSHFVPLPA
jgi:nonsense-mediated mRNA decay protein 3